MDIEAALKDVLPGKVHRPGTEQYDESNKSYFTVFESDLKPAAIIQPTNAEEVSTALQTLGPFLQNGSTRLAIRGSGHTPFAGSANIDDGITIDLRGLKGIRINEGESTVRIGIGETWGSVYDELEKHGLATAGGRVGRVGVGGLVLGGTASFSLSFGL